MQTEQTTNQANTGGDVSARYVNERAESRAKMIAEFEAMQKGGAAPDEDMGTESAADVLKAPEPESPAEDNGESTEDTEAEESTEAEEDSEEPAEEEPAEEAEEDPAVAKRLAKIAAAEERSKKAIETERQAAKQEIETMRNEFLSEWTPRIEKAERFEQLEAKAQYDLPAVLEGLGIGSDQFEARSRELYMASKAAAGDPKHRDAYARAQKDREQSGEVAQLRREIAEMKQREQQRAQQAAVERDITAYMSSVEKAVGSETPIVASMLEKSADKTRQRLANAAAELYSQTGERPDPEDVVAYVEKIRTAELEELGIDPALVLKSKTKTKAPVAAKNTPAKTLSNDLGNTTTVPTSAPEDPEERKKWLVERWNAGHRD